MARRIESRTSRTAELTCLTRAISYNETIPQYHCADSIAPALLPGFLKPVLKSSFLRRFYRSRFAPKGMFEYVVARTKYVDEAFARAVDSDFDQVIIFGAGFDSRAIRLPREQSRTVVYELDAAPTQAAKLRQLAKRGVAVPEGTLFVSVDFNREGVRDKLEAQGCSPFKTTLFIIEGLLMYLDNQSAGETFDLINYFAGPESQVVFDVVHSSVIRRENRYYGESELYARVAQAGEPWAFGLEKEDLAGFLSRYGMKLQECLDATDLEGRYFADPEGKPLSRVNGTHLLVLAVKSQSA